MPLLAPSSLKFRKSHTRKLKGFSVDTNLAFGDFGVIVLEHTYISDKRIETVRVMLSRSIPKTGKYWLRIFPDMSCTKRPIETRMGKGKSDVDHWEASVVRGKVLFEWLGLSLEQSKELAHKIQCKLGVPLKLIYRSNML